MVLEIEFDHGLPHQRDELFSWGKRLQREPAVYNKAYGGFWVVSRHAEISSILNDQENFINAKGVTLPPLSQPVPSIPLESDPPLHRQYRAVMLPYLSPRAIQLHDDKIRAIITDALDTIAANGTGDLMADFAARIPARAMAFIFGFSDEDAYRFDHDFSAVVAAAGSDDPQILKAAGEKLLSFLREKLEDGRDNPDQDNLVSAILKHEIDGRKLTESECLGLLWTTAGGAIDTTKYAIGHLVRELGVNREIRNRLIEDPSLIPVAIEESLRLNASAFMTARTVARKVTLGDVTMQPGDRVLIVHGWANRDEQVFSSPDEMNIDRKPTRHLTFGYGAHQCVGMHLARRELKIAIEELLQRIPDYELEQPDKSPLLLGGLMWGYDSLPIRIPGNAQA